MITYEPSALPTRDMSWSVTGRGPLPCTVQKTTGLLDFHNSTLALSIPATSDVLNRVIVVIDAGFDTHWGNDVRRYFEKWNIRAELVVLDVGEGRKILQSALALAVRLGELRVDRRRELLMAIGGGSLLDVVGLAANLFREGLPFLLVPTTLRAQIDAGTGIIPDRANNALGTYRAPTHVFVDTVFLTTIPRHCRSNGLAEILKVAIVLDAHLFELLEVNDPALLDGRLDVALRDELISRAIGATLAELEPLVLEPNVVDAHPARSSPSTFRSLHVQSVMS